MKIYLIPLVLIVEEQKKTCPELIDFELIDAPNFWYLHGALQHKFIYDKAYMYVDSETLESDIIENHDGYLYLASGIYDVEVEGYDKPCKAFMWQSEESGKIVLRGLVVDPTIEEDIKDAQKKYEEKPLAL